MNFTRKSEDGKYGLTGPDSDGYHCLWRLDPTGEVAPYAMGAVADPENFSYAVEMAEEEMRCLITQAREEFGIT